MLEAVKLWSVPSQARRRGPAPSLRLFCFFNSPCSRDKKPSPAASYHRPPRKRPHPESMQTIVAMSSSPRLSWRTGYSSSYRPAAQREAQPARAANYGISRPPALFSHKFAPAARS